MGIAWVLVPIGYVFGMFQSAEIVGRLVGRDPRREGSRNPGASNMYRLAGRNAGAIVLLIDVIKGIVPTAMGYAAGGRELGLAAGAAAILGHIFPAIRRFRGGKGVATFGGVTITLWPLAGAAGLVTWAVLLKLTGRASVASLAGVGATVVVAALSGARGGLLIGVAALGALIALRHRTNLLRLLHGDEARVT